MNRLFAALARFVTTWPRAIVCTALILTSGSVWLSTTRLQMNTNQDDLISESLPYHKRYKDYLRSFGDQEFLYVVVDAQRDPSQARAFAQALAQRLRTIPSVHDVVATIDTAPLLQRALLYLPEPALRSTLTLLQQSGLRPADLQQWRGLHDVWAGVAHLLAQPVDASARGALTPAFTALAAFLTDLQRTLDGTPVSGNLWNRLQAGSGQGIDDQGFITAGGGKYLFLFIMPQKDYATLAVIEEPLAQIRAALDQTRREFPSITAGLTGRPVLAADEMAVTNRDMTYATIGSMLLIFGLFWYALRRLREPVLVLTVLALGMSWSYGFAALTIGSLNLLSVVFSVILVAGVEFGVHIVTHYREERANGATPHDAITNCIRHTGRGNLTTALTTAVALYCACFTKFQALQELGWISGTGTLLCLLAMLTVLPAALFWWDLQSNALVAGGRWGGPPRNFLRKFMGVEPDRPRATAQASHLTLRPLKKLYTNPTRILQCLAIIFIALLCATPKMFFDHNLLNLQATQLESVQYEHIITDATGTSTWQAVVRVPDLARARAISAQLRTLPSVGAVESLGDLIPDDQAEKLALVQNAALLFTQHTAAPTELTLDLPHLGAALADVANRLDELASLTLTHGTADDAAALGALGDQLAQIRAQLRRLSPAARAQLQTYQIEFMTSLRDILARTLGAVANTPLTADALPAALRNRYVSTDGDLAVYATPRGDIWDPVAMEAFVQELRSIAPDVTGVPIEVYESSRLLERSFLDVALYAFAAIILLVWLDFRNLRDTLFAMTPLAFGLGSLFGLMGLFAIPFNLANFFAIPIIVGIAIDNGIQIIHRHRTMPDASLTDVMLSSTGTGALLAALTAISSFVFLCGASHQGIRSLGLVITLGILTCTIGAVILLPALLSVARRRATPRREELDVAVGAVNR